MWYSKYQPYVICLYSFLNEWMIDGRIAGWQDGSDWVEKSEGDARADDDRKLTVKEERSLNKWILHADNKLLVKY